METEIWKHRKLYPMTNNASSTLKTEGIVDAISERRISKETARIYNTQIKKNGSMSTHHIYQYFDRNGSHIANKVREVQGKKFWSEGNLAGSGLFGENIFGKAGKYITVCEGEIDAMSAYELLGSKWPVVSIKNGAASAQKTVVDSFEYLNKFDKVVLCFDNDKPGKEASLKVAELFEPNKCLIMNMELKDANEYLKTNQREKFNSTLVELKAFYTSRVL